MEFFVSVIFSQTIILFVMLTFEGGNLNNLCNDGYCSENARDNARRPPSYVDYDNR